MSCCGGGGVYRAPGTPHTVTGVAQPTPATATIYRVITPQQVTHDFYERYRAEQVLAMRGGSLQVIEPGDQHANEQDST